MEIIKNRLKIAIMIMVTFCTIFIFSGCGKYFWDYECIWVSDSPYVHIPVGYHKATIELNGEKKEVYTDWTNNGTEIGFYDPDIDNGEAEESIIWETECEVKKGKLYIKIVKDNVSNMEGKTIILEQQQLEDDNNEEWSYN